MNPAVKLSPFSTNDSKQKTSLKSNAYNVDQRNAVLHIYNTLGCNEGAIKVIKSLDGYEDLNERRIKRWMKKPDIKNPGRPISEEFEDEVIAECDLSASHKKKNKSSTTSNRYCYNLVKECALKVFNREYWNVQESSFIKKWHTDPHTSKLHFSNKWVLGVLQRDLKKRPVASLPIVYEEQAVKTIAVHEEQEVVMPVKCETVIDSYNADPSLSAQPIFADCFDTFVVDDNNDLEDLLSDIESFNRETTSLSDQTHNEELEKLLELWV